MRKTILITGASSGFGRLTAETLSRSGHKVFAGFHSTNGSKKHVADELKARDIEVLELDVTDQSAVMIAIGQLLETSKQQLDVVINNAGMASVGRQSPKFHRSNRNALPLARQRYDFHRFLVFQAEYPGRADSGTYPARTTWSGRQFYQRGNMRHYGRIYVNGSVDRPNGDNERVAGGAVVSLVCWFLFPPAANWINADG
jgi:NAD(P)-dependent dehydrogenase (short-subunit alcohol dehydrogenase family)